ncbi:MAG TPA: 30S ribosomal protein S1 [candidate division Zixibacteria bacterium]|nr:30S ribosomal protein S1 [candidate division Zixibacteria bacterium]HEQ97866.1 30S ribosomal protein S1 [candidate division Zixibacteria bacterium]
MAESAEKKKNTAKRTGGGKKASKKTSPKDKKQKSTTQKKRSKVEERASRLVTEVAGDVKTQETKRRQRVARKAEQKPARPVEEQIETVDSMKLTDLDDSDYDSAEYEELMKMYEETLSDLREGEIINGKVLGVTRDDVIVDVGFKSEGIIAIEEFPEPVNISVGDEIEVYLDAFEDQNGQLVLSKRKADFLRVWDRIRESYESGELVPGRVSRRIKGGLVVDLFGVDAFLPGSQVALRQVPNFDELVGREMELKIIKLNKNRRNIVVSRRVVLEQEREELRSKLLAEIEAGQVREGVVKNITDFGVFIDLGGVDGLLHITDMSWGRISHPSEMVSLGETINVKILDFDKETGRISLGLKQLSPYPWENIEEKYPVGKRVEGLVVSLTDYGAFIELEKGIEGLIHISEMSWTQHIKHPSKIMQVGDKIEAVVLSVDKENEKISLGLKQLVEDPWKTIDEKYPVGMKLKGRVRNLTTFGAFIELEEGIDGLIHISDMSWTKRIQHPSEIMKKGDVVDVVVLKIDKENRRISLGHKQLFDDPWPNLSKNYAVGADVLGTVVRILDRGVIVELPGGVEGFVPTNQLGKEDLAKPEEAFQIGDELPLQVIEFDQPGRRIVLSVDAYYKKRERDELEQFLAKHPTKTVGMDEFAGEEVKEAEPEEAEKEAEPKPEEPEAGAEEEKKPAESPAPEAQAQDQVEKPAEQAPAAEEAQEQAEKPSEEPSESAEPEEGEEKPPSE